jgi:hypothetical protein
VKGSGEGLHDTQNTPQPPISFDNICGDGLRRAEMVGLWRIERLWLKVLAALPFLVIMAVGFLMMLPRILTRKRLWSKIIIAAPFLVLIAYEIIRAWFPFS